MSKQKSILIVAAERGLGLGLVAQFFDRGWSIVGTARMTSDDVDALRQVGRNNPQSLTVAEHAFARQFCRNWYKKAKQS